MPNVAEEIDWEFYDYALRVEKEWRKSLPRFTDKELLELFPEAKALIPEKIAEWKEEQKACVADIEDNLTLITSRVFDEISISFWREWVKLTNGKELQLIEGHILRLERLQAFIAGIKFDNEIIKEQVQAARESAVERYLSQPLKRAGKTMIGLCPLHNEKTPSFHIYPLTNRFYCYGCNQGGDVITLIRLMHGLSFREAIVYLTQN